MKANNDEEHYFKLLSNLPALGTTSLLMLYKLTFSSKEVTDLMEYMAFLETLRLINSKTPT